MVQQGQVFKLKTRFDVFRRDLHVVLSHQQQQRGLDAAEDRERVVVHELAQPASIEPLSLDPYCVGVGRPLPREGLALALQRVESETLEDSPCRRR
jgi:hypothetical protein